jgi:hypothetical protein
MSMNGIGVMGNELKPLFLFSLPRSGSTLCQRILGAHHDIGTAYEPFILLPFLYSLREKGVYSEYYHEHAAIGIQDFCSEFPNGVNDYLAEMRNFVLRLYKKAANENVKYFLDKTPYYSWIVEDIIRLFPEGKFIFLWRNPLSIVSSIMESWNGGRWNLYKHDMYLYEGLDNLISAYQNYAQISVQIRYEDVITNPILEWQRVFNYLELEFDPEQLRRFSDIKFNARLATDPDLKKYTALSQEPLQKWREILANPIRKIWCRRYLRWIGRERLSLMGYDLDELLAELDVAHSTLRFMASDSWRMPMGLGYRLMEGGILKHKLQALISRRRIYIHK